MKILQLTAENIKKLVAVDITPTGNLVEISGRNGAGKTSVLDAIWWALGSAGNVQGKPVRDGQDKGFIRLDLGEYIVTRKFKVKDDGDFTTSITVENQQGARFQSPQDILDGFVGKLTFDPLAFARMKPADQIVALRQLVTGFDFAEMSKESKFLFDERTMVNREIKALEIKVGAFDDLDGPADDGSVIPDEPIDVSELSRRVAEAAQHNQAIEEEKSRRANSDFARDRAAQTVQRLENELAAAREDLDQRDLKISERLSMLEMIDIANLSDQISRATNTNKWVQIKQERNVQIAQKTLLLRNAQVLTEKLQAWKDAARQAVLSANLPVSGLEFGDDEILISGVPFEQISDAQKLRVSISVAAAMNPTLRVIRVRDGSLLDSQAMFELQSYADQNDLQIWIERVSDGAGSGVLIEDGLVVKDAAE